MECREKNLRLNEMQGKEPSVKWDAGKGTLGYMGCKEMNLRLNGVRGKDFC